MPLRPFRGSVDIERRLTRLLSDSLLAPFEDTVFRLMRLRYARPEDAMSGAGAARNGGRWNPPGVATFYGSNSPDVAYREVSATARHYGADLTAELPRVEAAFDLRMSRALDMTSRKVLRRLQVTASGLKAVDWRTENDHGREALTQAIGRLCSELGVQGIIARSAEVRRGLNVIAFVPLPAPDYLRDHGGALAPLRGMSTS
jgi:RES domain-containing protein